MTNFFSIYPARLKNGTQFYAEMAGEMTAQEWRTVSAVLQALQTRMRNTK